MEVWVRVLGLRQLPPGTVKGPVRVQAILAEERRETGDSVSKGTKTQETVWLRTPASTLSWRISEADLQRLKAYSPKFKCYVHTGEEVVAWCMLDVRDLASGGVQEARWVKLQGTGAGGEIRLAAGARYVGRQSDEERGASMGGAAQQGPQAGEGGDGDGEEKGPDALPIGEGKEIFLLTVELARWGGDGRGLLLPGPASMPMWLSYVLFGALARSDGFEALEGRGGHKRCVDVFRLQSRGDGAELADWFARHPWLEVYLCTGQRVVAVGKVDLWGMAMGGRQPREMRDDLFPFEREQRVVMESWEEEGPPGIKGGAWVDVRVRLERVGEGEGTAVPVAGEQGGMLSVPTGREEGRGGAEERKRGQEEEEEGEGEDDDDYSDDFEREGTRDASGIRGDAAAARREAERAPGSEEDREEYEERVQGLREEEAQPPEEQGEASDEEEYEVEVEDGSHASYGAVSPLPSSGPPSPPPPKPSGARRFRLSIDLRSVRDLDRPQHVFLSYHYPHLVGPPSVLDHPVLSHPVYVPAYLEAAMDKSCVSVSFTSTYDGLRRVAEAHPFFVSVKAKEPGGADGAFEIGKACLPFVELLCSGPINYRCPGKPPRLYRRLAACQRRITQLIRRSEAPPDTVPITVFATDKYAPILTDHLPERSDGGLIPSLHAVLVLEDMGPAIMGVGPPVSPPTSPGVQSVHMPRMGPPHPPPPAAGDVTAAMSLLDVERRKIEFEDWRHKREMEWAERLRAKEAQRMDELERSFVERERERKAAFTSAQQDLATLEAKLRRTVAEVEGRERRLASYEEELKAEQAKRAAEVTSLQRRLKDDAKHAVDLEKQRAKDAEDRAARLERSLASLEKKHGDLQEEYSQYRKDQRKAPTTALHADIAKLKGEKSELEARWERERAEKNQALLEKEQYRSALQRTARALKREQGKHMANLRQELEQLKIEYLAREERFRLDGEREELHTIKKELDALRNLNLNLNFNHGPSMPNLGVSTVPPAPYPARPSPAFASSTGAPFQSSLSMPAPPAPFNSVDKENAMDVGGGGMPAFVSRPPFASSSSPLWVHSKESDVSFGGAALRRSDGVLPNTHEATITGRHRTPPTERDHADVPHPSLGQSDPELVRLRDEREDLLSTGGYSVSDPIIQELCRLIDEKESQGARGGADSYGMGRSSRGGRRRSGGGLDLE